MQRVSRRQRWMFLGVLLIVTVLSGWARIRGTAAAIALGDAIGPWRIAVAGPVPLHPHAPPYGWGLYTPYAMLLWTSGSLWKAVQGLLWLHALVAPLGAYLVWRLRPGAWMPALVAGLVLALDGGLIDTAISGSEGYLGALWIGMAAVATTFPRRFWGPPVTLSALAMGVMNHPLALCALPLAALLPWRARRTHVGAIFAITMLCPQILRFASDGLPGGGGAAGSPFDAPLAWLDQGGPAAWVLLLAPIIGLCGRRTRPMAMMCLVGLGLLAIAGGLGGYLRDHHIRLLSVVAIAGLAALPGWTVALGAMLLRIPIHPVQPPGIVDRPGTLELSHHITDAVLQLAIRPIVVDGAWISSSPAAEPAAIMIDLWLRGLPASEIDLGGAVAVIVSADRDELHRVPWSGRRIAEGDRHFVAVGSVDEIRVLSARLCAQSAKTGGSRPRLGGAWDGMVALHPTLVVEDVQAWWACDP